MTETRPGTALPTFGSASVRLVPPQDVFASLLEQARGREQPRDTVDRQPTGKQPAAA
jgi:hypothetical protein